MLISESILTFTFSFLKFVIYIVSIIIEHLVEI